MQFKSKTAEVAVGRWPGILQSLGVDSAYLNKRHGPCPICSGKDRYRFDDKGGRGTWFCSHCGAGDGFRLLQGVRGCSFSEAAKLVDQIVGSMPAGPITPERTDASKVLALRQVWSSSREVTYGDPVWKYLNGRLGIEHVPAGIRLHPGLTYIDEDGKYLGRFPAMLAMIQYPNGSGASIHRTYLTVTGQKAPVPQPKKIMAGRPLNTGSVRLGEPGTVLGIAEGIETALAASIRFSMPVWAATNAVLLETWAPPAGVRQVLIAGDNDASYVGQSAAYSLARRLKHAGLMVEVRIPGQIGRDWADEHV